MIKITQRVVFVEEPKKNLIRNQSIIFPRHDVSSFNLLHILIYVFGCFCVPRSRACESSRKIKVHRCAMKDSSKQKGNLTCEFHFALVSRDFVIEKQARSGDFKTGLIHQSLNLNAYLKEKIIGHSKSSFNFRTRVAANFDKCLVPQHLHNIELQFELILNFWSICLYPRQAFLVLEKAFKASGKVLSTRLNFH